MMQLFEAPQEQTTSDDYYTPAWLFEDLGVEFDMDVASPPGGVPWIPAKRFLTQAEDGLSTPWEGRVWMNPPYSKPDPWVRRFVEHGDGIALLQTSRSMWHLLLWHSSASVVLLPNNFSFAQGQIFMPTFLWAMGGWAVEAIGRVGHVR